MSGCSASAWASSPRATATPTRWIDHREAAGTRAMPVDGRSAKPPYPGRTRTAHGPRGRFPRGELRMSISEDSRPSDRDAEGGEDPDEDPGEDLEAMIEQADRSFASGSFGTTAEEQEEGETLDQRLAEGRPARSPFGTQLAI